MSFDLFLENGYINFEKLYKDPASFVFCVGARGTGKTYGSLKYMYEHDIKFIYLRSKDTVVKKLSNNMMNPFKPINDDLDINIIINKKNTAGVPVFLEDKDDRKRTIGYMMPLSTFSNFRGFDLSDVSCIIYDEFIPEENERGIKDQADTLFNAYETINRNRELKGDPAVKLICLSNSNTIFNDIFMSLRLTRKVYQMMNKGQVYYHDHERGLSVYNIIDSPISAAKQQTALYRLTAGSSFQDMAIKNEYTIQNEHLIRSFNLSGFRPVAAVGECYIYCNSDNVYYMSVHQHGVFSRSYSMNDNELQQFRRKNFSVWFSYLDSRIFFEDIYCMEVFNLIYSI